MVGDDGNRLTVMPAVVVFGKGQGVVGVVDLVVACCACPDGLIVIGVGCAGALNYSFVSCSYFSVCRECQGK